MSTRSCDLFFNQGSGSEMRSRFYELQRRLLERGFRIRRSWLVGENLSFAKALRELESSETPLVVVGGGDGTLSGVTPTLLKGGKLMGVVPAGTFNFFARNHNIPLSMDEAIEVIAAGTPLRVPVGKVNDEYFLNTSSFGLYPTALKKRQEHYRRWGRGRALALWSLASTLLGKHETYRTTLTAGEASIKTVTPFVFVSTNELQIESMGLRGGETRTPNDLAIYVTECLDWHQRVGLAAKALLRRLENAGEYQVTCSPHLTADISRKSIKVALDGELKSLCTPLEFSLVPSALRLMVPKGTSPA
ncbi:MAG TPA: diacylglycerol kinase family protein [Bdellovibrionota bacterium]|nr:diacylglycerol kinase family protein [Bdellovibrionota bacterium]